MVSVEYFFVFYNDPTGEYFHFADSYIEPETVDGAVAADSAAAATDLSASSATTDTVSDAPAPAPNAEGAPLTMPLDLVDANGMKADVPASPAADVPPGADAGTLEIVVADAGSATDATDTFFNPDPFIY